jgi:cyanophycinase-like exopeptidase
MSRPRILALMGSGETAPPLARVHRALLGRLGPLPTGVLLDTPYGFQENAAEITARAVEYFSTSVGLTLEVATFRDVEQDPVERATSLARLAAADVVFSGPGSPSYALRVWEGSGVPGALGQKLANGGLVTFASAAALTLGSHAVPVYEIYKVGAEPRWLTGLDVLGRLGLDVAVIPHYDNAEGGTHDTRFCYLGERRLLMLERELPRDHFILGIDSHTALILDFEAGEASVEGRGGVTVRAAGRSEVLPVESRLPIGELAAIARRLRRVTQGDRQETGSPATGHAHGSVLAAPSEAGHPLMDAVRGLEHRFDAALTDPADSDALRAVLEMETLLTDWSRDTDTGGDVEAARSVFRALIVRLAERSGPGTGDPMGTAASVPTVLIELLIEVRMAAREVSDWSLSDRIRDALAAAGVELRDRPEGTTWHANGASPRAEE